jgi:3D (Asp-Asp-Asp) domain-containing protein
MNYSMNVRYKKNRKQAAFRRIMVSWVIILVVGMLMGFFIGRSIKKADAMPMTIESSIHSPTITHAPYVRTTHVPATSEQQPKTELVSLGEFKITAYCHCEQCCGNWAKDRPVDADGKPIVITASGEIAVQGVTIAADTSVLPFGTKVIMDGHEYTVQDRGGAIKGNKIDVYFESHQEVLEFGVQYKELFIERMIEND